MIRNYTIHIQGIVQGVGFRPFIKNLSDNLGLCGNVRNSSSGVTINLNIDDRKLNDYIAAIRKDAPPLSHIVSLDAELGDSKKYCGFKIEKSGINSGVTLAPVDSAICADCRAEISDPTARRYRYPFTNCTNCGPRYSIINKLPYDRADTTMVTFHLCPECESEYLDPKDRRFHAEPIACPVCGPKVWLDLPGDRIEGDDAIKYAAKAIDEGVIIALKGLGGYHLVCDAKNDYTVLKLRGLKNRATKPLAVMCKDIETLDRYIKTEGDTRRLLLSHEAPIVIFEWEDNPLSKYISPSSSKIGVMIAYTPLHVILLDMLNTDFIVATSGNMRDEPIAKDEDEAISSLKNYTDIFLHHDRPIHTRLDDSVTALTSKGYTILRRSRGFAPYPCMIKSDKREVVFAAGANLKSGIAFYKDGFAFLSQYIGDLDTVLSEKLYLEVYDNIKGLFGLEPTVAAADLHPGYRSRLFADSLGIKEHLIQHHVAHFASCLAENAMDEDAVGVIMDGFGLGVDDTAWGGEFFVKKSSSITRAGHILPVIQPGMDSAAKNPYRMAISYLRSASLLDKAAEYLNYNLSVTPQELKLMVSVCDNMVNSIMTTSAGRLFEAMGSLLLKIRRNEYEGQAAIDFENIAERSETAVYKFITDNNIIDFRPAVSAFLNDILNGVPKPIIAASFHNGFAEAVSDIACRVATDNDIKYIALSGGVFQNIRLFDSVKKNIEDKGLIVLAHTKVPANDGGIALGQLYAYLKDWKFN